MGPDLANRLRELVSGDKGVREQRMFGGLAFLVNENMAVAASREVGLLLRVHLGETDASARREHAAPFVVRGRPMDG